MIVRAFALGCAVVVFSAVLPAASARRLAIVSRLPSRYLATVVNSKVSASAPGAKPNSVEILNGYGRVLRVVARGVSLTDARWSPNGRMIAWLDARGLNVENADGSERRLLAAHSTHCVRCDLTSMS